MAWGNWGMSWFAPVRRWFLEWAGQDDFIVRHLRWGQSPSAGELTFVMSVHL